MPKSAVCVPFSFWVFLVAVTGCASRPPNVATSTNPHEVTTPRSSSIAGESASSPRNCRETETQRGQVPQLLEAGKLHRTLEVITEANRLCPAGAGKTHLAELQTLAEMGRYKAARDLASQMLHQHPSPSEQQLIHQALQIIKERDVSLVDTDAAKSPMLRTWQAAEAAAAEGHYREASHLFIDAWQQWHPHNGRALARAGHFAKLAGDGSHAQRLFDRAIEELEQQYQTKASVEPALMPSRFQEWEWFADGKLLAIADRGDISLLQVGTFREVFRLSAQSGEVNMLAVTRDGKLLAAGSDDGTIRIWRVSDGTLARVLNGTKGSVRSLEFSPDGSLLVSASARETLRLWRSADGALLRVLRGHGDFPHLVGFFPDGKTIVSSGSDGTVRLWASSDGSLIRSLLVTGKSPEPYGPGVTVLLSPDGKVIATSNHDGSIRLWASSNGLLIRTLVESSKALRSIAFSPDGTSLASDSDDGTIRLWRLADGLLLRSSAPQCVRVDSISSSSDGSIVHSLSPNCVPIHSISFSPNGKWILASTDYFTGLWGASDLTLEGKYGWERQRSYPSAGFAPDDHLYRTEAGRLLQMQSTERTIFGGLSSNEYSVVVSPDGKTVASASVDNTIRLRRLSDGALLHRLSGHGGRVTQVAFAPDGKILASASKDKTIRLWQMPNGSLLRSIDANSSVTSIAFAPNGKTLASGSDEGNIEIWRVLDGSLARSIDGPSSGVASIAFSPDGETVASACSFSISLWHVSDGSLICSDRPDHYVAIAFAPDGRLVATKSLITGEIKLFQSSDCKFIDTRGSHDHDWSNALAYTPDGKAIAAAHGDRVLLESVANDATIRSFYERNSDVSSLGFDPTGKLLVTSGHDGLRLWRTNQDKPFMRLLAPQEHDVQITLSGSGEFFDLAGKDESWAIEEALICRVGPVVLPVETCAERARVSGLGAKLMFP